MRFTQRVVSNPAPGAKSDKTDKTNGKTSRSFKSKPGTEEEHRPRPLSPAAGKVEAYYDSLSGGYYARNVQREFMNFPLRQFSLRLRSVGFSKDYKNDDGLSYLESELLRITESNSVHYAGPLGGFDPGRYDMAGTRILVTRGPIFIEQKPGDFPLLKAFFIELLGEQRKYLFAWLKWAIDSLRRGLPWSPGQMLAVAGPPSSGKSFLQSLITPILGGRVSSPYAFMAGGTEFNSEIFGAEHGLIGDQNHATDMRSRRNFGSAIKNLVVNKEQYIHTKGRTPITLFPFLRLTLSLNSNPEAMLVLPPLDSDVADKIILLSAKPVNFPFPSKRFPDSQTYYAALVAEIGHFIYHLRKWKIPPSIADQRYGVVSFHDPELVKGVDELSSEWKLWQTIESTIFEGDLVEFWEGTSLQLEREIRSKVRPGEAANLFPYNTACGQYLAALARKMPDKMSSRKIGGNKLSFMIQKP